MNLQPHTLQALKSSIKSTECFQKSRGGAVLSFAGRQSVLQRWSRERARVHPLSGSSHSRSLCVSSQFGGDFLFFSSYTLYPPDTPVTWGWKTNLLINDSYADPKPQLILNSKGPCVQLPRKAAVWEDQIRIWYITKVGKLPLHPLVSGWREKTKGLAVSLGLIHSTEDILKGPLHSPCV